MRIGTLQLFRQGVSSILEQQSKLFDIQQQLSTGKRIVKPSDDPSGAAQVMGLSESMRTTGQYQDNIRGLRSRLELEDSVLASSVNALQRARELAVQGLNDTNALEDRAAIAQEVRQIMDEVLRLSNQKDTNGDYLFAGTRGQTIPFSHDGSGTFAYAGDQGQRSIQVGPTRRIVDGDSGLDVFMKVPDGGGGYQSVFGSLYKLATDLEADAPDSASLDQLDTAIEHLLTFQSAAGARLNAADSQSAINEAFLEQLTQARSDIEDLDYAKAASLLSQQSVTLQAAQQAFVRVQNLNLLNFL